MFEIVEVYNEMVDLKLVIVDELGGFLSVYVVKKINILINQSIKFFQSFIDLLKYKGVLFEKFDEDML